MRKKIAFISALVLTALSIPMSTASAEGFAKGDVDMDGIITGRDAAIVSQYADGILKLDLTDEQLALADMNGDGIVDAADAALIAENQEYCLCDMDKDGIVTITDISDVLGMLFLKKIDPEIDFGEKAIHADIDCNGVLDAYDAYGVSTYYARHAADLPCFEENKFYLFITPEKEQQIIKDTAWLIFYPDANITNLNELHDFQIKIDLDKYFKENLDVDGDEQVTISDATTVLQMYAENAAGTGIYKTADTNEKADINLDGKVDIDDAKLILKAYAMNAAGLL